MNRIDLSRRGFLIGSAVVALGGSRGALAQTPSASPVAGGLAPFVDRLGELLALVPPADISDGEERMFAFSFADLERQLAATGMPMPMRDNVPDGFHAVIDALPLASNALPFALQPEWWDTFGFEPLRVGRTLEVGEPPNRITVFAGGFETDHVHAALLAAGYREVAQETGGSYLTFGEELDLTSPVGRLGVGSMNQAIVRDGVVIFTREEATIQQVTQVMAGYAPSMLEQGGWPDLMATLAPDVVGVTAMYPAALRSDAASATILQLAFAVREGADNRDIWDAEDRGESIPVASTVAEMPDTRARVQVRIRYTDAETARREVEAIPERWSTMPSMVSDRPLTELMLVEDAYIVDGDPTVGAIDFRVQGPAGRLRQIIATGDLAAFIPES